MKKIIVTIVAAITLAFGGMTVHQASASAYSDGSTACKLLYGTPVYSYGHLTCSHPNNAYQGVCVRVMFAITGYYQYSQFVCYVMGHGGSVS